MDRTLESRARELLDAAGGDPNDLAVQLGEPLRMITIRLPASYHEALRTAAHREKMSMNKLSVLRLMNVETLTDAASIHLERLPPAAAGVAGSANAQGAGQSSPPQPLSVA